MGDRHSQRLIKHVEFNAFWRQNAEMAPEINEKALGKQRFQSCKPRTQKILKTLGKTMFCEDAQCIAKYLIKPVELNAFWRQNAETAPKISEKH